MLVIRRRAGESVLIGENIEVRVLELSSSYVKIGIDAPRDVAVLRREIQVTAAQNHSAAGLSASSLPSALRKLRLNAEKEEEKEKGEGK
ncbi:MAG: carbon storage regulator [Bryobacteraceae bacterium]